MVAGDELTDKERAGLLASLDRALDDEGAGRFVDSDTRESRDAIRHLLTSPESGTVYTRRRSRVIRRWLMPKTRYHIYYRFDADAQLIVIYTLWAATRGRGPEL